jgi:ParB-like chromosome segregation protein Spo0J
VLHKFIEPLGQTMSIRDLKVETVPVSTLKPYPRNPRTHSKKQLCQIADSIRCFGWTNPILIDANGGVIAGHGRLEAARLLGVDCAPTIRIEDMTEAQKRAYILADNKLAENAGWDRDLLALELQGLLEMDLDFEVTMTGFDTRARSTS